MVGSSPIIWKITKGFLYVDLAREIIRQLKIHYPPLSKTRDRLTFDNIVVEVVGLTVDELKKHYILWETEKQNVKGQGKKDNQELGGC